MFAEQARHPLSHLPSPQELNSCESWNIKSLQEKKKKNSYSYLKEKDYKHSLDSTKKKKIKSEGSTGKKKYQSTSLGNW